MGDLRDDFIRLFTRGSRKRQKTGKGKGHARASGKRITDPLGASRVTTPTVVHPAQPDAGGPRRPELTIVRPPEAKRPEVDPRARPGDHRVHVSLSHLGVASAVMGLVLLVLVSFVLGTRYERSRAGTAVAGDADTDVRLVDGQRGSGGVTPTGNNGGNGGGNHLLEIGTVVTKGYRLRIGVYPTTERESAEKSVTTLTAAGIPAAIEQRSIGGRSRLAIYATQVFADRTSAEAEAFRRKVQMVKQEGRYDFASAYYVVTDD